MNLCEYCGVYFDGRSLARYCKPAHRAAHHRDMRATHSASVEHLLLQAASAHVAGDDPTALDRVAEETERLLGVSLRRRVAA